MWIRTQYRYDFLLSSISKYEKDNHILYLLLSPNDPVITASWLIGSLADLSNVLFIESAPPPADGSCNDDDPTCP
jgi:hypothetical protein